MSASAYGFLCWTLALTGLTHGQEALPDFRDTAVQLQQATVTIRVERPTDILSVEPDKAALGRDNQDEVNADGIGSAGDFGDVNSPDDVELSEPTIDVFTGVCLGDRLVAAPMLVGPSATVRVTLIDGEQCSAQPVVVDEFTGLALLRLDRDEVGKLSLADSPPDVGEWILSSAAWGIERPVISYGVVGGIDRRLAGTHYPPLLLCDLRTTDTSSGSPIVNRDGDLVGVLIAATSTKQRGWTYAIPTRHVRRLLRTLSEHRAELARKNGNSEHTSDQTTSDSDSSGDSTHVDSAGDQVTRVGANGQAESSSDTTEAEPVIVIQHRRPIVGMVLEDDGISIVVAHVTPSGPADKAGIRRGDRILGLEGVKIRSVYQAVLPTFHHQPGEVLTYRVQQDNDEKDIAIVLGGDVALPASSIATLDQLIDPKIRIKGFQDMLIDFSSQNGAVNLEVPANAPSQSQLSSIALLERAIVNYQSVIAIQHQELQRQEDERKQDRERLESLERELKELRELVRKQSDDGGDTSGGPAENR